MTVYFAFLRAINVGGHTVKMDQLRHIFEEIGFANVATFIASGNVIFEAPLQDGRQLEIMIEEKLRATLGYKVSTFIRTKPELHAVGHYQPFTPAEMENAQAFNVAFLAEPPAEDAVRRLAALRTEIDNFNVHGREIYWLCRQKQSQSTFSNAVLERAIGLPSTLRGVNTVQRMAALYPEEAS
jgi:uncharacterized protein (DUF1697 family)